MLELDGLCRRRERRELAKIPTASRGWKCADVAQAAATDADKIDSVVKQ